MIQSSHSRSGHWIFKLDGTLMASRNDPVSQAQSWIENQKPICNDEAYMGKQRTLFVLGLGCGYHVLALLRKCSRAQIVVIEARNETLEWVFNHVERSWESRVTMIVGEEPHRYFDTSKAKLLLRNPYCVLPYAPAMRKEERFYSEWQQYLLARDGKSLEAQMKLLDPLGITRIGEEKSELLSIKDLKFKMEDSQSKIWNLLSEMIQ